MLGFFDGLGEARLVANRIVAHLYRHHYCSDFGLATHARRHPVLLRPGAEWVTLGLLAGFAGGDLCHDRVDRHIYGQYHWLYAVWPDL